MNRARLFDHIEEKLINFARRIESRGGLNILDLHLHAETFYAHFLNLLFGWKLENVNATKQNVAGIDLVDIVNKIVVQVSATATKRKINSALSKDLSAYKGHSFKFVSIVKDAKDLRTKTYNNPNQLTFVPSEDILDIPFLLRVILNLSTERQQDIHRFLKNELKSEPDTEKIESNLTTIISILSKEDWHQRTRDFEMVPFDIEEKISYNKLSHARALVDDYKIHYHRIDRIYSDFDKQGANKSLSILNGIRTEYLTHKTAVSPDSLFFSIIDTVVQRIQASGNYVPMPEEELSLCVQILVVDAFIRCKIFKNPLDDPHAHS